MSYAYETPGFAAAEAASLNPPDDSFVDENDIQRRMEDAAESEISHGAQAFRDWLADSEHAVSIALAVTYWPGRDLIDGRYPTRQECDDKRAENMDEALGRMARDYIAYRVASHDLREDALRSIEDEQREAA